MLLPLVLMPSCREEQTALSKELESTKAELLDLQLKRNKVSWCSKDIVESKMRLQELAECLRAALQEEVRALPWGWPEEEADTPCFEPSVAMAELSLLCSSSPLKDDDDAAAAPSKSRAWTPVPRTPGWQTPYRIRTPASRTPAFRTPHRAIGSSFVGSVLKAVSGEGELVPAAWRGWGSLPPVLPGSAWISPYSSYGLCRGSSKHPGSPLSALGWMRAPGVLPAAHKAQSICPLADADEAAGVGSAFTKDKPAATPKATGTRAFTLPWAVHGDD